MNCFVAKHLPSLKVIFFKCLKRSIFPFVCPNSGETLSAPSIYIIILCNLDVYKRQVVGDAVVAPRPILPIFGRIHDDHELGSFVL